MIIGLHGPAGSGKDTVGLLLQEIIFEERGINFEIKKFGYKLKQIAALILDVPVEKFEDREFKESTLGPEWDYWTVELDGVSNKIRFGKKKDAEMWASFSVTANMKDIHGDSLFEKSITHHVMTVRQFLQDLATEGMRDSVHPHIHINPLLNEHQRYKSHFDDWIITDVRFEDECDAIHDLGGKVYRIEDGVSRSKSHKSETLITGKQYIDDVIDNSIRNIGNLKNILLRMIETKRIKI